MMKVTLKRIDGSDLDVVNAARVSHGKRHDEFCPEKDGRLIRYLASHGHWTPFAHVGLSLHVKAPIFVERQLFKHVVGLVANSISRRYIDAPPEFHYPEQWKERPPNVIKQGSGEQLDEQHSYWARMAHSEAVNTASAAYSKLLTAGVSPEMARMVLPLCTLTEWIWTGSLHAFARVCRLRLAPDAQAETREIARQIAAIAAAAFPVSWDALVGDAA